MKKLFFFAALIAFNSLTASPSFAATFRRQAKMTRMAAQELNAVAAKVVRKDIFGDAGISQPYSFVRKATEKDLNTVKQLNHAKGGLNSDDEGAAQELHATASELATFLIGDYMAGDDEEAAAAAARQLTPSLRKVLNSRTLKVYTAEHSDEDGTWKILNVLDTRNDEVLIIRLGGYGT